MNEKGTAQCAGHHSGCPLKPTDEPVRVRRNVMPRGMMYGRMSMYENETTINEMATIATTTIQVRIGIIADRSRGEKAWACRIKLHRDLNRGTEEIVREFLDSRTEAQIRYHGRSGAEGERTYLDDGESIRIQYDYMEQTGTILEWTHAGEKHLGIADRDGGYNPIGDSGVFELDMTEPWLWEDIKDYLKGTISAGKLKYIRDAHEAYMRRRGFHV